MGLSELQVEQTTFIEHHFYSKECPMNYGYLDLGIWQIFFLKMIKVSFHFKENNW